jgi:predicted O-methyltransferase YrrM
MKLKNLLQVSTICLFSINTINSFNISYTGNDAETSYQTSWGKERFIKEDYIKYFPHYKKYVETIPFINISTLNIRQLPYPYNQIKQFLPFNEWGMYFNYDFIKKLFDHNEIINVIEIGSYYGLSTRHIASLLPESGKLYAIDSWEYDALMYDQFLSNIIHKGLTSKIFPIKQQSEKAITLIKYYAQKFDLIFVDGDHETAGVLKDLELYYPLVKGHGIICGDDWLLKTVRDAVLEFAQKYNLTVYGACNFWFLKDEGQYQYHNFLEEDEQVWHFTKN